MNDICGNVTNGLKVTIPVLIELVYTDYVWSFALAGHKNKNPFFDTHVNINILIKTQIP